MPPSVKKAIALWFRETLKRSRWGTDVMYSGEGWAARDRVVANSRKRYSKSTIYSDQSARQLRSVDSV